MLTKQLLRAVILMFSFVVVGSFVQPKQLFALVPQGGLMELFLLDGNVADYSGSGNVVQQMPPKRSVITLEGVSTLFGKRFSQLGFKSDETIATRMIIEGADATVVELAWFGDAFEINDLVRVRTGLQKSPVF